MKKVALALFVIMLLPVLLTCCNTDTQETETNVLDNLKYSYTEEEMARPYWTNTNDGITVVYNEVVTPIQYGDSEYAIGFLNYTPLKIISVRDYTLKKEYDSSQYVVSGNKISVKTDGSMPYVKDEWLDGKDIPEEYLDENIFVNQAYYTDEGGLNDGYHVIAENALTRTTFLSVTYAYDSNANPLGFEPTQYSPDKFNNFLTKLQSSQPVKILVFGDSISVGASASSMMGFEPNLPTWFDIIKQQLAVRYYNGDSSKITLVNPSVGGTTSEWGVEQVQNNAFDKSGYDLVIIGFGMNDGFAGFNIKSWKFSMHIQQIYNGIKESSPNADFILLSSFTPNPLSVFAGNHQSYLSAVQNLADNLNSNTNGCTHVNMFDLSMSILKNKQQNNVGNDTRYQYLDISANYCNHPNDFMVRLYAGNIMSAFIEW